MDGDEALYLTDSYLTAFDAQVRKVEGSSVWLTRTAFYPTGGGQPSDTGQLSVPGSAGIAVVGVEKSEDGVVHTLAPGTPAPPVGSAVHGQIDWTRRYQHMRYHTLLHLLSGAVYRRFGSGTTGGQITAERARMDFSMPEFNRAVAEELLEEVNRVVATGLTVRVRFVDRAAVAADPSLVRVAAELLPSVDVIRLIDIGGYDVQADGGTHVRSTREVGLARLERVENKGARNKRLYLTVEDPPPFPPPSPIP